MGRSAGISVARRHDRGSGDGGERRALGTEGGVGGRGELAGVGRGDGGQLGEEPVEVLARVDFAVEAGTDERIEDGSPVTGVGGAHEEVVLFADGARADGFGQLKVPASSRFVSNQSPVPTQYSIRTRSRRWLVKTKTRLDRSSSSRACCT